MHCISLHAVLLDSFTSAAITLVKTHTCQSVDTLHMNDFRQDIVAAHTNSIPKHFIIQQSDFAPPSIRALVLAFSEQLH